MPHDAEREFWAKLHIPAAGLRKLGYYYVDRTGGPSFRAICELTEASPTKVATLAQDGLTSSQIVRLGGHETLRSHPSTTPEMLRFNADDFERGGAMGTIVWELGAKEREELGLPLEPPWAAIFRGEQVSAPARPSLDPKQIDALCAKVPIRLVPMRVPAPEGQAPMVDRLALVGEPVTEVIGAPVIATSDVDTSGTSIVHFNQIARERRTGLGPVDLIVIAVLALGAGFFAFVVAALLFEAPGRNVTPIAGAVALVAMPIVAWASYRYGRRPAHSGWTSVVGVDGVQVGTVNEGVFDRTVLLYTDPSDVWFESTTMGVRPGAAIGDPSSIYRTVVVRSAEGLSPVLEQFGGLVRGGAPLAFSASRVDAERFFVLSEAWYRAAARRLPLARHELAQGRPVVLPVLDGRKVTLRPSGSGLTIELQSGGRTVIAADSREVAVQVVGGIYDFRHGGARETIERHALGNPYVIDALLLGLELPQPTDAPLPRAALVPPSMTRR